MEMKEPEDEFPGSISQWMTGIIGCSSSYDHGWEASCLIGAPKVYPHYGDLRGTWAPLSPRNTREYLELAFHVPVFLLRVDIFETFNPGRITKLSCSFIDNNNNKNCAFFVKGENRWKEIWHESVEEREQSGTLPIQCSRIFSPAHYPVLFPSNAIRIDLDCTAANSWVEIDAVRVIGVANPILPWTPNLHKFLQPSFKLATRTLLLSLNRIFPEQPFGLCIIADVIEAAAKMWQATKEDRMQLELKRAKNRCGYSALANGWVCRGTANGCVGGPVFGSGAYSNSSSICSCAVHSGIASDPINGFSVGIVSTFSSQTPGSIFNGIQSGASRPDSSSFVVCETSERKSGRAPCGKKGAVWWCHGISCGCLGGRIWGGQQVYRAGSNPCTAALHSGIITDRGGAFLVVESTQVFLDHFPSVHSNGIQSESSCERSHVIAVLPLIFATPQLDF